MEVLIDTMEVPDDVSRQVVEWLASMGYPVVGMPTELLRGMLLHEACKWDVSPPALVELIHEDARDSGRGRPQWTPSSNRGAQSGRRRSERPAGVRS